MIASVWVIIFIFWRIISPIPTTAILRAALLHTACTSTGSAGHCSAICTKIPAQRQRFSPLRMPFAPCWRSTTAPICAPLLPRKTMRLTSFPAPNWWAGKCLPPSAARPLRPGHWLSCTTLARSAVIDSELSALVAVKPPFAASLTKRLNLLL